MRQLTLAAIVTAAFSAPAFSQSFNLSFGGIPSSSYGAATGQAGNWNHVMHLEWSDAFDPTQLVGLAGNPTTAFAHTLGCDTYWCDATGWGPDVEALFSGIVNGDCYTDPGITTITGLRQGRYLMTVYGSHCNPSFGGVSVNLSDGSFNAGASLTGAYDGTFDQMSLGEFVFDLQSFVNVQVRANTYEAMSAIQLTRFEPPMAYCTSQTNSQGCQAMVSTTGGFAASFSDAAAFTVECSDVLSNAAGLFFFGFGQADIPFGGGTLCVQGQTVRTPVQSAGSLGAPCTGVFAIDINAFLQAGNAPSVQPGSRLDGQYWYRDANDPLGFGSATSDAIEFWVTP